MPSQEPQPRLEIRRARAEDAAALCEIFNEGVQDGLATFDAEPRTLEEQQLVLAKAAQDTRHAVLVGELGRWVLGWSAIEPCGGRAALEGVGEVTVYVRRSFRKHGVGKQLMRAAQVEAAKLGYRKLIGYVLAENADSLRLCWSTGFREIGRMKQHARIGDALRDVVLVECQAPELPAQ